MLSVEKCREILGINEELGDDEIDNFQVMMRGLINLMLEEELKLVKS